MRGAAGHELQFMIPEGGTQADWPLPKPGQVPEAGDKITQPTHHQRQQLPLSLEWAWVTSWEPMQLGLLLGSAEGQDPELIPQAEPQDPPQAAAISAGLDHSRCSPHLPKVASITVPRPSPN